ncbi:hypothetical protein [Arthrobacter sp. SLBN-122]|uniref:hypothetical protein n=1 Tax=Arthrobacter sp. SLBN-122 TaxID=2768455 RepID=UPI001153DBC3|nr:hypothetical protein [Arthrobacter sp. SLBN-122]
MDQQDDHAVPPASGQKNQPAPVWGGAADGATGPDNAAGWGTTPTDGQVPNAGTGWGAPQQYPAGASSRSGKGNWTAKKGVLVGGVAVVVAAAAGAGAYAAGNGTAAASTNNGVGTGATGQSGTGGQSGMTGQGGMTGPGGQGGVDGGMAGGTGMDGGPGAWGMGSAALNAAVHSNTWFSRTQAMWPWPARQAPSRRSPPPP